MQVRIVLRCRSTAPRGACAPATARGDASGTGDPQPARSFRAGSAPPPGGVRADARPAREHRRAAPRLRQARHGVQRHRPPRSAHAPRSPGPSRTLPSSSVPERTSDRRERVVFESLGSELLGPSATQPQRALPSQRFNHALHQPPAGREGSVPRRSSPRHCGSRCGPASHPAVMRHWTTAVVAQGERERSGCAGTAAAGLRRDRVHRARDAHVGPRRTQPAGFRMGVMSTHPAIRQRAGRGSSAGCRRE